MKKVEQQMIQALKSGQSACIGNTQVTAARALPNRYAQDVYLHGNLIATLYKRQPSGVFPYRIYFTLAGWPTVTTRSRLNAILGYFSTGYVCQRKGQQFYGYLGEEHPIGDDETVKLLVDEQGRIGV